MKQCPECNTEFEPTNPTQKWCTPRCGAKSRMRSTRVEQRKLAPAATTQREAAKQVSEMRENEYAHNPYKCWDCGEPLWGKRSNAFWCTNTCRMRYVRREQQFGVMRLTPKMRRNLRKCIRDCHGGPTKLGKRNPKYDVTFKVLSKKRFHDICNGVVTMLKTHEISELSRAYPGALMALGIDA